MTMHRRVGRAGVLAAGVVLASGLACVTPSALAQAAGSQTGLSEAAATPASVVRQAQQAADAGRVVEARSILDSLFRTGEIDAASAADREAALTLMRQVEATLRATDPLEVSLQKAELALDHGDLREADRQASAVAGRLGLEPAMKERAESVRREIAVRRAEFAPAVPGLIEHAIADFEAGDYAQAKSGIAAIIRSGVSLSAEQRDRLQGYQYRIVEVETARGEAFNIAPLSDAALGMMQPGATRRPPTQPKGLEDQPADNAQQMQPVEPAADQPGDQPVEDLPETSEPTKPAAPEPAGVDDTTTQPMQPAGAAGQQDGVVRSAMTAEAQRYLSEAQSALKAGRYNDADQKFSLALSTYRAYLTPEQVAQAEAGRSDARVRMTETMGGPGGMSATPGSLSESELSRLSLIQQQLDAEFNNLMEQASTALSTGDTDEARQLMATAKFRVNSARDALSEKQRTDYLAKIDAMVTKINQRAQQIDQQAAADREKKLQQDTAAAERARRLSHETKINESMDRIRALQAEKKYKEALAVVDEVLFLEPNQPAALLLRDILSDIVVYKTYNDIQQRKQNNHIALTLDNENEMVPPIGLYDFPMDWPAKTRERGEQTAFNDTPENRRVLSQMSSRYIPASFNDNTLADVLTFIGQLTNLDIDIDWESLNQIGVERETLVSLNVSKASVETVLNRVLNKASRDEFNKAGWTVENGILTIASDQDLRKRTTLIIYNITDLLFDIPDYADAPTIDLEQVLQNNQGGGGGGSPFEEEDEDDEDRPTRQEKIDRIVEIIQANVDFEGWRDNGGETGALQELNGSLIVTNTPANHREIVGLLSKLREIRNMQINVETKFLLVNQNWFEQIGFDLDIVFNANNNQVRAARAVDPSIQAGDFFNFTPVAGSGGTPLQRTLTGQGPVNGQLGPITNANRINQAVRNPRGFSPVGAGQNSLGLTNSLAEGDFANQILSAAPALGIAGQFLDDIQVDFLIQATQADKRSVQLTAPRLTFTNGQTSNIYVATQQAFISDLQPVTSDSAVGFDPTVNAVAEGVTMLIEGVISSDRRYVTLNVDTSVSRIDGFAEEPVVAVAGGQLVNSAEVSQNIQLPTVTVTRVRTTVTVPDEGTILLGGQRLVTEVEVETGVPVLSKLPILNRFFTNRLESKEEQTLLVLIKPTIIIQTEQEERHFPGLLDAVRAGTR